ncbi:MAG: HU family DNA-binding protein [Dethiobacter sp.]|nr:HU family DNA-binding protein [Dethiobacter sp.]
MDKADLARSIAEQMNTPTKDAETFLTTFADIVSDSLDSGERVRVAGFLRLRYQTR